MTVEYVGPFEAWDVVVGGHVVPFLSATPMADGDIHVLLDRRFGLDLSAAQAEEVLPFIADCIAVALGYTCHPCEEVPEPPRRRAAAPLHSLMDSPLGEALL